MRSISPSPRRNGGPARTQRLWEKHRRGCWWVWKRRSTVILRRGTPLTALKGEAIGAFRRDIQLVFQDAFSAVNPRKTVRGSSASRCAICCACRVRRARRVEEMLLAVDLAPSLLDKRPAQLSGGQLQRVGTRPAVRPQLLILMKRFQISICCCRRRLSPC